MLDQQHGQRIGFLAVEQAALQIRMLRVKRRASISLGSSSVRNRSNGRMSRKKLVSLMVMARDGMLEGRVFCRAGAAPLAEVIHAWLRNSW